jgi:broad specificity phosphatase PhoE
VTQPQPAGRSPQIFDRGFLTDMEDVTQVILVRHGEQFVPDWRGGPVGDTIDPPLSERGERQAELVGLRFSTQRIDAVYASPLRRALETGRQIARHHRLEPTVWSDLREVEVFRNVPPEKNAAEFIGQELILGIRERFLYERSWDVYPHSETSADFRRRTVNAIEAIIASNEGKRVAVACHGGVINAYIGHIIRSPYDMFFRPAHTSVSVVAAAGGIRAVHSLNDVHHLFHGEESWVSH